LPDPAIRSSIINATPTTHANTPISFSGQLFRFQAKLNTIG
jgi:hypothetical protein